MSDVAALSTGQDPSGGLHTCVVHTDGTISCWGPGHKGQLGLGNTETRHLAVAVPGITDAVAVAVPGITDAVAVAVPGITDAVAVAVPGITDAVAVAVPGITDAVAVAVPGITDAVAVAVPGITDAVAVAVPGITDAVAVAVPGITDAVAVAVPGITDAVAVAVPGITDAVAVAVPGITDAVAVAVGSGFACVAHRDGGVSCWGRSWYGQLGVRMEEPNRSTPERVSELADVVAISAGEHHSCAVHRNGDVSCWGWVYGSTR